MYQERVVWAKVILKKYCSPSRTRARDPDALPCSLNWKAIKTGFPIFSSGNCWGVGNGVRNKVWFDKWLKGDSLRDLIQRPLCPRDLSLTMEEFKGVGGWNWDLISFELLDTIRIESRLFLFRILVKERTPLCGDSLEMVISPPSQPTCDVLRMIIQELHSKGSGYGSLTFCLKSSCFFGCVYILVFLLRVFW